tara:strand:+ start:420 stop:575 length:156 start_codon:yes stop_codon:yes gene_type:complete
MNSPSFILIYDGSRIIACVWDGNDNLMLHEDFWLGYKTREDLEFKKAVKLV